MTNTVKIEVTIEGVSKYIEIDVADIKVDGKKIIANAAVELASNCASSINGNDITTAEDPLALRYDVLL